MAAAGTRPKPIEVRVGRDIVASVLVGRDAVYVASTREDVVALDRATLQERWRSVASGDVLVRLLDDDLLIVGGREGPGARRTADGAIAWRHAARMGGARPWKENVIVLDVDIEVRTARTGALVRSIPVPGGFSEPGPLGGETMIVIGRDGHVQAYNLETASKTWSRPLVTELSDALLKPSDHDYYRFYSAARAEDIFVAARGGSTFGCSIRDGSILWQADAITGSDSWPTIVDGQIFLWLGDRVTRLDERTGAIVFDVRHPELAHGFRTKAGIVHRNRVAMASELGELVVLDADTGALITHQTLKQALWKLAEADGRLLVSTGSGTLLVFDEWVWGD